MKAYSQEKERKTGKRRMGKAGGKEMKRGGGGRKTGRTAMSHTENMNHGFREPGDCEWLELRIR